MQPRTPPTTSKPAPTRTSQTVSKPVPPLTPVVKPVSKSTVLPVGGGGASLQGPGAVPPIKPRIEPSSVKSAPAKPTTLPTVVAPPAVTPSPAPVRTHSGAAHPLLQPPGGPLGGGV
jgi:hypothetical protein